MVTAAKVQDIAALREHRERWGNAAAGLTTNQLAQELRLRGYLSFKKPAVLIVLPGFVFDQSRQTLIWQDTVFHIGGRMEALLLVLAKAYPRGLTAFDISTAVWGDDAALETVRVYLTAFRRSWPGLLGERRLAGSLRHQAVLAQPGRGSGQRQNGLTSTHQWAVGTMITPGSGYDDAYVGWATRRNARLWHYFDGAGWALCDSGHGMRAFRLIRRLDSDRELPECGECKALLEREIARGKKPLVVGKQSRQWGETA